MQAMKSLFGKPRRGMTLTELIVAMVVLAAAWTILAQSIALSAAQRRTAQRHAIAREEAANLLERAMALPWTETTAERLAEWKLAAAAADSLPGARLKIDVRTDAAAPREKQVRVAIDWLDSSGQPGRPVQLSAWKFGAPEATP